MALLWRQPAADAMPIILTNRGLVFPTSNGASAFDLRCNEAYGALTSARPGVLLDEQSAVVVATQQDILRTSDEACTFRSTMGLPTGDEADALGSALGTLALDPSTPGRGMISTIVYKTPAQLFVTTDYARTWTLLYTTPLYSTYFFTAIAPDPKIVVATGKRYDLASKKIISIYGYSADGGKSFVDADTDGDRQPLGFLPNDSNVVFMREALPNSTIDPKDKLLRSADGGKTFTQIGDTFPTLSAYTATPDGKTVWVSARFGGIYQSDDSGNTFRRIHDDMFNGSDCLYYRQNTLWACANIMPNQDGIFTSVDQGKTFQQKMVFEEVKTQAQCADLEICEQPWRDWSYELLNGWNSTDGGSAPPRDFDGGAASDAGTSGSDVPTGDTLVDAGAHIDAGQDAPQPGASKSSSGCALGGNAQGGLLALALAALLRRRRRWAHRAGSR